MPLKCISYLLQYKSETQFLTFETTTLVPYERKLINTKILSEEEVCMGTCELLFQYHSNRTVNTKLVPFSLWFQLKWLNMYNQRIKISIGPELIRQNKLRVYKWLLEQTQPYCWCAMQVPYWEPLNSSLFKHFIIWYKVVSL